MFALSFPRNNEPYISFTRLAGLIDSQEEMLHESNGIDDLFVPSVERESSADSAYEKQHIAWDFSEYTGEGEKGIRCKRQIEHFVVRLPTDLNGQEALMQDSYSSNTEISSSDDETLYAEELEERQVLAAIDTEEGEGGEQEIIYRAIPLLVISDEQGGEQQYCSSTETFVPIVNGRQTFDLNGEIFNAKRPKAQQSVAAVDMENGKEGERFEQEEYSAIPLRFLSDKQVVKQQYCASTKAFMPVANWRQNLDSDGVIFNAESSRAQQAAAPVDMEKGKEGERREQEEYSTIRFLSDKQVVKQQYCASTKTFMPITDWRQNADLDGAIFNAECQKAEQKLANFERTFKLLADFSALA